MTDDQWRRRFHWFAQNKYGGDMLAMRHAPDEELMRIPAFGRGSLRAFRRLFCTAAQDGVAVSAGWNERDDIASLLARVVDVEQRLAALEAWKGREEQTGWEHK